jgi:uncharacterized MAPEG superfamily protein
MSAAHWCVLLAALMPYPLTVLAKGGGGYDNHDPRNPAVWADGFRRRAHGAQHNAFEAFPPFAAAVIIAWQLGARREWLDGLAVVWVLLRIAYTCAYLGDRPSLRSTLWTLAFVVVISIFLLGAFA